ncbi:MAG: PA domain-containing protein, partial [Planctomycetota bacterium]
MIAARATVWMVAASALGLSMPLGAGGAAFGQADVQPVSPDEPPLQVQPSVEPVPSVDRAPAAQQPVAASADEASEPEPYSRAWLEALRERVLADVRADIARAGREAFPPRDGGELADLLLNTPDPARLRAYHDLLAGMPHDAGTEGDAWTIETLGLFFGALGLELERHEIDVLLSRPERAEVRVFAPDVDAGGLELALREGAVEGDRFSAMADARRGWNAYSGSGAVRGRVVYANYGTLEDFERLRALGVDLNGAIVLARYGRNFRGFKARFAEAAGAAGLLMYTDPGDAGWGRGLSWPEGGWANETHIQRGSLKTAPYPGDVLTPFEPSVEGVARQNPERVELPR